MFRGESGRKAAKNAKVPGGLSARFVTTCTWSVERAAHGGLLDAMVAAGLGALPLNLNDLLALTASMGKKANAVFFISRWQQVVQAEDITVLNAKYLARAVEAVFVALKKVVADGDMGDGKSRSNAVVGSIIDILHVLR